MSKLFSRISLRASKPAKDMTLGNRLVIAPMCQYSAKDGAANDWHLYHWANLLNSGAGAVILEATAVSPEGRITPSCLGLWDDCTAEALEEKLTRARRLAPRVPVIIQLAHAGRKGSCSVPWQGGRQLPLPLSQPRPHPAPGVDDGTSGCGAGATAMEGSEFAWDVTTGWETVSSSTLPMREGERPPVQLDHASLNRIRDDFVAAARRAEALGVDGIELHAAHGYLLHQFLSPVANRRTDAYGGSLANRMRFPLEVFGAMREAYGGVLGVRVSATDWVGEGAGASGGSWGVEECGQLAVALRGAGCGFVHVSSGGVSAAQRIPAEPHYQVPLARSIRDDMGGEVPVIAVGLITDPVKADAVLRAADADLIGIARAALYQPRWGWRAAVQLAGKADEPESVSVPASPQYWRCLPRDAPDVFVPVAVR